MNQRHKITTYERSEPNRFGVQTISAVTHKAIELDTMRVGGLTRSHRIQNIAASIERVESANNAICLRINRATNQREQRRAKR